jgi:formylglycine-generating enzyme required for sulfatase activity
VDARVRSGLLLTALLLTASCRNPRQTFREPRTGLRFVLIPAGRFEMGSPAGEQGHRVDETLHTVTLTRPFYISTTEVTQEQWMAVMGDHPSHFRGPSLPVESVTWFEVQEFLRRLSASDRLHFRLPTEAEWEYACRAGSTGPYSFGAQISTSDANYDGRYPMPGQVAGQYRGMPTPVASFPANAWGL